jgi:hypothetical protein
MPQIGIKWRHDVDNVDASLAWRYLMERYSCMQLTYARDCFPALSGLAKAMDRNAASNYLAGLWKDSLLDDLLWVKDCKLVERPADWRAPTWSWASTYGGCNYQLEPRVLCKWRHVEGIDTHCEAKGADICGELSSASIVLAGRLIPAKLLHDLDGQHNYVELGSGTDSLISHQQLRLDYHPTLDTAHHLPSGTSVRLLLLLSSDRRIHNPPGTQCYGIVLRCLNEEEALYKRVASCHIFVKGVAERRTRALHAKAPDKGYAKIPDEEIRKLGPWFEEIEEGTYIIV